MPKPETDACLRPPRNRLERQGLSPEAARTAQILSLNAALVRKTKRPLFCERSRDLPDPDDVRVATDSIWRRGDMNKFVRVFREAHGVTHPDGCNYNPYYRRIVKAYLRLDPPERDRESVDYFSAHFQSVLQAGRGRFQSFQPERNPKKLELQRDEIRAALTWMTLARQEMKHAGRD